ncbi:MAG: hypothetical protein ACRBC3_23025 [Burkholderiaceae bacterium]
MTQKLPVLLSARFIQSCVLIAAGLLSACGSDTDAPTLNCTAQGVNAVTVLPVDEEGNPLADVQVIYRANGGDPTAATCFPNSPFSCNTGSAAGEYLITVSKTGYQTVETGTTVEFGDCGTINKMLTVVLNRV